MLKMTAECGSHSRVSRRVPKRAHCTTWQDMDRAGAFLGTLQDLPDVHSDSYSAAIRPKARVV